MSTPGGGPALIGLEIENGAVRLTSQLTLRDYFAAKAMQSILTAKFAETQLWQEAVALLAFQFADAMIAERSKP